MVVSRLRRLGVAAATLLVGCAALQQLAALRLVEFALGRIVSGRLAGVDLGRIRSYADLSPVDGARIGAAVVQKDLPLEFTIGIEATNPESNVTARMTRLQ